jgi:hypothetical protein
MGGVVVAYQRPAAADRLTHDAPGEPTSMICTLAPQQGHVAAGARPCIGLVQGYSWNAAAWLNAPMTQNSSMPANRVEFVKDITAKRQARHLGVQPT